MGWISQTMSSISVVIPAYNAGKYLPDALQSLQLQSRQPDEVVIVDDGSEDDTLEIAQGYKKMMNGISVSVVPQINAGVSCARNVGIHKAKGDLIALLDADDYLESDHLEILAKGFTYNDTVQLVFGASTYYDANLKKQLCPLATRKESLPCSIRNQGAYHFIDNDKLFHSLLPGSFISPSAIMFQKNNKLPLFNKNFSQGEDRLFLLHMVRSGLFVYVDKHLARIRRHDANATNTDTPARNLRIIKGRYELNKYLLGQTDFALNTQDVILLNNTIDQQRVDYNYNASLCGLYKYLNTLLSKDEIIATCSIVSIIKSIIRSIKFTLKPEKKKSVAY